MGKSGGWARMMTHKSRSCVPSSSCHRLTCTRAPASCRPATRSRSPAVSGCRFHSHRRASSSEDPTTASMSPHVPPSGSSIGRRKAANSAMPPKACAGVAGSFRYQDRAIGLTSRRTRSSVSCARRSIRQAESQRQLLFLRAHS